MFFLKSLHLSIFFFRAIIQHFTQFILGDFAHPQWQPNLHLSTFIHLFIYLAIILHFNSFLLRDCCPPSMAAQCLPFGEIFKSAN